MKLSVVIPAYNEIHTIAELVRRVELVPVDKEIVFVDNDSTDGTRQWIEGYSSPAKRILHSANLGKGRSVRDGLAAAEGEIAIVQDADLEYHPRDIPALLEPIRNDIADVVLGSRVLGGKTAASLLYDLGGRLLNASVNLLYRTHLTDTATGYKAFHRRVYRSLELSSDGFELDFELVCRILRAGFRIVEVPISYTPRSVAEGKKVRPIDGVRCLAQILRHRVARRTLDAGGSA